MVFTCLSERFTSRLLVLGWNDIMGNCCKGLLADPDDPKVKDKTELQQNKGINNSYSQDPTTATNKVEALVDEG